MDDFLEALGDRAKLPLVLPPCPTCHGSGKMQAPPVAVEGLDVETLARTIVNGLFVNGNGDEAYRLVLTARDGRNLGGWSRPGARLRILDALRAVAEARR